MTEDMEKDAECGAGELAILKEQRCNERYEALMKKTAIIAAVFSFLALLVMFVFLNTRSVVLADTALVSDASQRSDDNELKGESFKLPLTTDGDCIKFSLPEGTNSEDIVIENRVTCCQLAISIADSDGFYTTASSVTTPGNVTGCLCVPLSDGASSLEFQLDGIYEYTSTLDNGTLSVSFVNPHEMYDRIVVIDPVLNSLEDTGENDTALYEALAIKDKLEKDGVKVYLSRTDSNEIDLIDKEAFVKELAPDLVICIDCDTDTAVYYNDSLYLRNYGNDSFAGQVLADISYEVAGKGHIDSISAYSLSERPYELMTVIDMPSVLVTIPEAYTKAEDDSQASLDHSYQDSIANGIYKAVMYAYADIR